jgi:OOP family OmpA-OmpF porin
MQSKHLVATAVLALLLTTPAVRAGQPYAGGSLGRASLEGSPADLDLDFDFEGDDTGYKLFGGYRFFRYLAIEASVFDLGNIEDSVLGFTVQADLKGLDAYAVGVLPAGRVVQFFGKAGYARWDFEAAIFDDAERLTRDDSGTDFTYGIGATFRLSRHIALRAEWEVFELETADNLSFASVGIEVGF